MHLSKKTRQKTWSGRSSKKILRLTAVCVPILPQSWMSDQTSPCFCLHGFCQERQPQPLNFVPKATGSRQMLSLAMLLLLLPVNPLLPGRKTQTLEIWVPAGATSFAVSTTPKASKDALLHKGFFAGRGRWELGFCLGLRSRLCFASSWSLEALVQALCLPFRKALACLKFILLQGLAGLPLADIICLAVIFRCCFCRGGWCRQRQCSRFCCWR